MPSEIVFAAGASVKVLADIEEVRSMLNTGASVFDTNRFAGFRGDEAVGGERVVVALGSVAYAIAIAGP
jgi:hypothetical protein